MSEVYLFVYGTLLTGTGHKAVDRVMAEHARDRGAGTIQARLFDLGPYPGAVPSPDPEDQVQGRLFALRMADQALARLDAYEGCPRNPGARGEFLRRETAIARAVGPSVRGWVYYYSGAVTLRPRIPSGDYLAWLRRRRRYPKPQAAS